MSAAVSARSSIPTPITWVTWGPAWRPSSGRISTTLTAANAPATVQTMLDIRLGLMPASRAASALDAAARTAIPYRVLARNQVTRRVSTGMTTIASTWSPRTGTPSTSHDPEIGVGKLARLSTLGREMFASRISCATPTVATNRITLGASKRRRTTVSSISSPHPAPTTSTKKRAG